MRVLTTRLYRLVHTGIVRATESAIPTIFVRIVAFIPTVPFSFIGFVASVVVAVVGFATSGALCDNFVVTGFDVC